MATRENQPELSAPVKLSMILGGGGVAGIAWMTGWLYAFEQQGFDSRNIDRLVGTSAGATMAAQLASKTPMAELYARQINPDKQVNEITPRINLLRLLWQFLPTILNRKNPRAFCQQIAAIARKNQHSANKQRIEVIKNRLPSHNWPDVDLHIMAIEGESGDCVSLNKTSGVNLVDAVAASCAVPGVWPTVDIGEKWYIDGGILSPTNSEFAMPSKIALILAPMGGNLKAQAALASYPCQSIAISPNKVSKKAMGINPLNPKTRIEAAKAGYEQGKLEALDVINAIQSLS